MRRADAWLVGPVVVAAAVVFVFHGGEIARSDHFFFQVMGLSLAFWILLGAGRAIGRYRRK